MEQTKTTRRGRLKVFLGYAAGVGKTFRMLEEARELKRQGVDVVIGYFEPHGRKDTMEQAEGLEVVPRVQIGYRGVILEEMNTPAVIARHPAVALVDEFAHTNVPGSTRAKRWEDVMELLDAGIDVWTTMNVQHLESINDQVREIAGVQVRETIPDWVINEADEVVMVDATPMALINRLKRGVVYPPDKAKRALENFFKESTLVALREVALRQTAHEVEVRHEQLDRPFAPYAPTARQPLDTLATDRERLLLHITSEPTTAMLIRRGRRVADFTRADCFAVFVSSDGGLSSLSPVERQSIEQYLNFARNLHIETQIVQGEDDSAALLDFARRNRVTQLYLARPRKRGWRYLLHRDMVANVIRHGHDLRIAVLAERRSRAR